MSPRQPLFRRVFVLDAEMEQNAAGDFVFLESDQNGYIGGYVRVIAAQILLRHSLVGEMFAVGGPTRKERVEKSLLIAKMIGGNAKPLRSFANTSGNFSAIAKFYKYKNLGEEQAGKNDGVLSHSYHFQRIMLETTSRGLRLAPIPAEGVILLLGTPEEQEAMRDDIRRKCADASYAERLLNEARGCFEIQMKSWSK